MSALIIVPVLHVRAHAVVPEGAGPEVQGEVTEEVAVVRLVRVAVAHAKVEVDLVEVAAARLMTARTPLPMTALIARLTTGAHVFLATTALMSLLTTVHVIPSTKAGVAHDRRVAVVRLVEV